MNQCTEGFEPNTKILISARPQQGSIVAACRVKLQIFSLVAAKSYSSILILSASSSIFVSN
jgi:hypothetical protein